MIPGVYRVRKPHVRAVQLTADADWDAIAAWCGGLAVREGLSDDLIKFTEARGGVIFAYEGDWIIRGTTGGFFKCQPWHFEDEYEPVSDG